jgi:hypothetical protein
MFNYFIFFLWFTYFMNFQVEATLFEKVLIVFFVVKGTGYLYDEYLKEYTQRLWDLYVKGECAAEPVLSDLGKKKNLEADEPAPPGSAFSEKECNGDPQHCATPSNIDARNSNDKIKSDPISLKITNCCKEDECLSSTEIESFDQA